MLDVQLSPRQAYLISDQPLRVHPLGYISDRPNWLDILASSVEKVRMNTGGRPLESKVLGFDDQKQP